MTQPWRVPLLERRVRRALVIGCYGGYALFVLAWVVTATPLREVLTLLLGLLCVTCMGMLLMPNVLGVSDGMETLLDERQRAFRHRAYVRAYALLSGLVVATALYTFIAVDSGRLWLPQGGLSLQAVFWGVLLLVLTLPTALIAWTEPEPPSDLE
jgi:hypothetical protein